MVKRGTWGPNNIIINSRAQDTICRENGRSRGRESYIYEGMHSRLHVHSPCDRLLNPHYNSSLEVIML